MIKPNVTFEQGAYVKRPAAWVNQKLSVLRPMKIILSDGEYHIPTWDYFLTIIHADLGDRRLYLKDYWDCDDFALWFKVIANSEYDINSLGYVHDYSSGHAYNSVLFPEGNVMLLEPQTDSLVFLSKRNRKFYGLKNGFVLV